MSNPHASDEIEVQRSLFDYAALDSETRIVVQQRTSEIKTLMRRSAQDIIDIGQKLIEVKARLGHGEFGAWLSVEFEWSDFTARQFMNVASRFKNENFSDLNIGASALYALAAPSTPEPARVEAIERARAGEAITHSAAKTIINGHKPAKVVYIEPESKDFDSSGGWMPPQPAERIAETDDAPLRPHTNGNGHHRSAALSPPQILPVLPAPRGEDAPNATPKPNGMAVHFSSETPEHYTPQEILDATIACMGGIDLDPCSNSHESPNVPATTHYTQADNGLQREWHGRVYMNPPYGSEIAHWVQKLVESHQSGAVTEAIALVPSRTDTQWWQLLSDYPVCFVEGRLRFGNAENKAPFPSAVFYLPNGTAIDRFYDIFSTFGNIWQRTTEEMIAR